MRVGLPPTVTFAGGQTEADKIKKYKKIVEAEGITIGANARFVFNRSTDETDQTVTKLLQNLLADIFVVTEGLDLFSSRKDHQTTATEVTKRYSTTSTPVLVESVKKTLTYSIFRIRHAPISN